MLLSDKPHPPNLKDILFRISIETFHIDGEQRQLLLAPNEEVLLNGAHCVSVAFCAS